MDATTIGWTEDFSSVTGLDQLGMRVSSEGQYISLIDFTTTVTWHPRYCSLLAWATREAYRETSVNGERVERGAWRRAIRRRDYLAAAATLAHNPVASAIIGVDRLSARISATRSANTPLALGHDHIGRQDRGTGSLAVYGGTLRAMDLVREKDGILGPSPTGERLAEAFESSAHHAGLLPLLSLPSVDVVDLVNAGAVCGLDRLATRAGSHAVILEELNALREVIIDWRAFGSSPRVRRRILTVGVILACFAERSAGVDLPCFREIMLLGGVRGSPALALPPAFRSVLDAWRLYQAHANAILALETLLALALLQMRNGPVRLVPRTQVLDGMVAAVPLGAENGGYVAEGLEGFWNESLTHLFLKLDSLIEGASLAPASEADIARAIEPRLSRNGNVRKPLATAHDAALLFLWTLARLRNMRDLVTTAWASSTTPWRRPPAELLRHADRAVSRGLSVVDYLREVFDQLVLRQHISNARRKLGHTPSRSTALFLEDGGYVEGLALHGAGTTNPRFSNAVSYLADLGYLTPEEPRKLTVDGEALLSRIMTEANA